MKRMKKWLAAILAVLMILSLTGCAPAGGKEQETLEHEATAAAAPSPAPLPTLVDITADQVRQINVYGDPMPPDTPEEVYCTDEVPAMLGWLQGFMATPVTGPVETAVPGNWRVYEVVLFDGTAVTVSFWGRTLSTGGVPYKYTAPARPDLTKPVQLFVEGDSFPAGTETIKYFIIDDTGGEQVLLFIPALSRATPSGWENLDCEAEFCGVPDPLTERMLMHDLPLKEWFPDAGPGVYRLSMQAYDDNDDPYMIADVFEIR
jgi:hypothetical protein